jgi:hypothetical protein
LIFIGRPDDSDKRIQPAGRSPHRAGETPQNFSTLRKFALALLRNEATYPDEWVWSHVKRTGVARSPLRKGEKLKPGIHDQLEQIQHNPKLVRSFSQHPDVSYISDLGVICSKESSKNNPLFFAGSDSKKGWAKPPLFWREKQENPRAGRVLRCFYMV